MVGYHGDFIKYSGCSAVVARAAQSRIAPGSEVRHHGHMMPPRSRLALLAGTTVVVVVFTLAVLLDRPARHSPAVPSVSSAATPSASGLDGAALPPDVP